MPSIHKTRDAVTGHAMLTGLSNIKDRRMSSLHRIQRCLLSVLLHL